jgi:hypothetical protein
MPALIPLKIAGKLNPKEIKINYIIKQSYANNQFC